MNGIDRRPGRRYWLAGALILSLAVNAFVLAAVATDFLRVKHGSGKAEARAMRFELRWLEGRLAPDAMGQVEAAVMAAQPRAVAHFDRLRQLRSELAALAAVPTPDRAAIDGKLADVRAEIDAMQKEVQAVTMDALLALPAEARTPLAQAETPR